MIYDPFSPLPAGSPVSSGLDLLRGCSLVLNGKTVPLLSGEVQFFRMDPAVWETCLRQVKALGLPIVSTYLSWRRFSAAPGEVDLTGRTNPRLNLPAFLDLCQKIDLWVTFKPGPWICAEETNGGYPDWLVSDPELQVLDARDQTVLGYNPPFQSPIPSYLHPHYQEQVRRWLEAVDRVVAPYLYPHGPVVLVQLDNEPGYTFHDRAFESDYNPVIARPGGLYARWLQQKYGGIERLNTTHRSNWPDFEAVQPPRSLKIDSLSELPKFMDWAEFKEWTLAQNVHSVGWYHLQNGVDGVLFTTNFNEHPQLAAPNNWHALEQQADGIGGFDYYPRMPVSPDDFIMVAQAVNYSRTVNRVPWSPEIMTGIWSFEGQEHGPHTLPSAEFEYLYLTCLAYGLKGMNFYMLADRDNWVNSPLDERGRLTDTAPSVQKTVRLVETIPHFGELEIDQSVAVVYYRPYAREAFLANETPAAVDGYVLGEAHARFKSLYADLMRQNLNPAVVDLWAAPEQMNRYRQVFFPAGPYLDESARRLLADYVRGGGTLVVFPGQPALNLDFSPLSPLELEPAPELSTGGWQVFRLGQGRWIELSSGQIAPDSLAQILRLEEIAPAVLASLPGVQTVVHRYAGQETLFVINTLAETATFELAFPGRAPSRLVELPEKRDALLVRDGKLRLTLPARTVNVYSLII